MSFPVWRRPSGLSHSSHQTRPIMYSSPAAPSLPARHPARARHPRRSWEQAPLLLSGAPGRREDCSQRPQHRPYLAGGDATQLAPALGSRLPTAVAGFPQTLLPRSGAVPAHTCGFSAWMLSLPFLTFFSSVTIFVSAQWPFLWEVALIRSKPIMLGS